MPYTPSSPFRSAQSSNVPPSVGGDRPLWGQRCGELFRVPAGSLHIILLFALGGSEQRILARLLRVGVENGSTPLIGKPSRDRAVQGDRAGAPCTPGRFPQDTRPVKVHSPAA